MMPPAFARLPRDEQDLALAIVAYEVARDARDRATAVDDQQEMDRVRNACIDRVARLLRERLGQGVGFFEWEGVRWSVDPRYGEVSWMAYHPNHKKFKRKAVGA